MKGPIKIAIEFKQHKPFFSNELVRLHGIARLVFNYADFILKENNLNRVFHLRCNINHILPQFQYVQPSNLPQFPQHNPVQMKPNMVGPLMNASKASQVQPFQQMAQQQYHQQHYQLPLFPQQNQVLHQEPQVFKTQQKIQPLFHPQQKYQGTQPQQGLRFGAYQIPQQRPQYCPPPPPPPPPPPQLPQQYRAAQQHHMPQISQQNHQEIQPQQKLQEIQKFQQKPQHQQAQVTSENGEASKREIPSPLLTHLSKMGSITADAVYKLNGTSEERAVTEESLIGYIRRHSINPIVSMPTFPSYMKGTLGKLIEKGFVQKKVDEKYFLTQKGIIKCKASEERQKSKVADLNIVERKKESEFHPGVEDDEVEVKLKRDRVKVEIKDDEKVGKNEEGKNGVVGEKGKEGKEQLEAGASSPHFYSMLSFMLDNPSETCFPKTWHTNESKSIVGGASDEPTEKIEEFIEITDEGIKIFAAPKNESFEEPLKKRQKK